MTSEQQYTGSGGSWGNVNKYKAWASLIAAKSTQVRETSNKILIFEEDAATIEVSVDGRIHARAVQILPHGAEDRCIPVELVD